MSDRGLILIILISVLAAGCIPLTNLYKRPPNLNLFYDRVVLDYAIRNPELLSYSRIPETYGFYFHNSLLTDASDKFAEDNLVRLQEDLRILRSYNYNRQTTDQKISTDILEWYLDNQVKGYPYLYYDYPLNQLEGVQNELPNFMISIHTIKNKRDARNYISRLSKFGKKLGQVLEGLKYRETLDILPPDFIVEKVLRDMNAFVDNPATANILYLNFEEKLNNIPDLKEHERTDLLHDARSKIEKHVYPAYQKLIFYFKTILPKTNNIAGVWKFKNGDKFYAYKLKLHTTTALSPEEVHQIGLQEVNRIEKEIRGIFDGLHFNTDIPIAVHLREIATNPKFLYPNTDEGRRQYLEDYEKIISEAEEKTSEYFINIPRKKLEIRRIPKFKEATASGAYYEPPSYDGSRPGVFYANLRDMNALPKFGMRTLAYHEAIPGHHFQVSTQLEMKKAPLFRKVIPFTAFVEGWALYAEKLASEQGLITDPYDNLGRLQAELFRAIRLVVDSGIHYKRWSRQEAIQYMQDHSGMDSKNIISEVERYIVDPGHACAYKIGELKILELREKAKKELGEAFDLRDFHAVVLGNGNMPMVVLEKVVDNYIVSKKSTTLDRSMKKPAAVD